MRGDNAIREVNFDQGGEGLKAKSDGSEQRGVESELYLAPLSLSSTSR